MVSEWHHYICTETLADTIELRGTSGSDFRTVAVGDSQAAIAVFRQT
jgi:hypothetical protein